MKRLFIPYPENHVCKGMDEWFSGGIPLHERKTEKSETTAVKPWSFILSIVVFLFWQANFCFCFCYALDWKRLHEEADKKSLSSALAYLNNNPNSLDALYILGLVYLHQHQRQRRLA